MILYIVMVYPWEREKLLFPNETENATVETKEVLEGDVIFKKIETTTIGSGTGARVGFQGPYSFQLDYPLITTKVKEEDISLSANIFKGDVLKLRYDGMWKGKFVVEIKSVVGEPIVEIVVGNTTIYSGKAEAGNLTFYLEKGQTAEIRLKHGSYAFWMTSRIEGKLYEFEEYYQKGIETFQKHYTNDTVEYEIELQKKGEIAEINVNAYGDCELTVKSGDNIIYRGPAQAFQVSVPVDVLSDKLIFAGEKGCNATLEKVSIRYRTKIEGGPYYFSFPVNASYDHIYIAVNVNGIIEPGDLTITLLPSHKVYVASASDIGLGWNYIEIDKEYLEDIGNKAIISSSGKLSVIGFAVVGR